MSRAATDGERAAYARLAAMRAHLELPRLRKAAGLLDGRHRSILTGKGQDFDDLAQYHPGDDVGDIDWRASASIGQPVIRRFERESNLAMLLVVDTGRNMTVPSAAGVLKSAVAQFACDVIGLLAAERGDAMALLAGDAGRMEQLPSRSGAAHMELMLARVASLTDDCDAPSDVTALLRRAEVLTVTRRTLIVLVTDEAHPEPDAEQVLRRLRTRHEVIVLAVADAPLGALMRGPVEDVDAVLALPPYVWSLPEVRAEAQAVQDERRAAVVSMLRRLGIGHVIADSQEQVVEALSLLLSRRRRG